MSKYTLLKGGMNLDKRSPKFSNKTDNKNGQAIKKNTQNVKTINKEKRAISKNKHHENGGFDMETETVIQMTNRNRIKKEEEQKKQKNKKMKKKNRRAKIIKIALTIFLFIILITGSIIFALTSPIFNTKNITVINNEILSSETIISLSEIKPDENIFNFNESDVAKKIMENPYIESVQIKRNLPGNVEINVKKRIPKYSVKYIKKFIYINNQGYLLEISEENKDLPIIYGAKLEEEIKLGSRLNKEDLNKLEDVIKIISSATENGLENKITSIDITDKNDYIIYIEEQKKKIHLGDISNLSNKMLYILAIMEQESGKEGDIFVNGDINNKFQPYFREKV